MREPDEDAFSLARPLRQATLTAAEIESIRGTLERELTGRGRHSRRQARAIAMSLGAALVVVVLAWWLPRFTRSTPSHPGEEREGRLSLRLVREDGTVSTLEIRYRPETEDRGSTEDP